jgi:hypothetical protein
VQKVEADDEESKEILNKLNGLHNINTPLYHLDNRNDSNKINTIIQQNYLGNEIEIIESLQSYVSTNNLADMLDFSRKDFKKQISLTPKKSLIIKTKWDLVKLGEIAEIQSGGTPSSEMSDYWDGNIYWATLVDTKNKFLTDTQRKITEKGLKNSSAKLLPINTIIFSSRATIGDVTIAKVETATNQGYKNFICNDQIEYEYLYYILKYYANEISSLASGMTFKEISKTVISDFKIPLPLKNIQNKIVDECKAIDNEVEITHSEIETTKRIIEDAVKSVFADSTEFKTLDKIADLSRGASPRPINRLVAPEQMITYQIHKPLK